MLVHYSEKIARVASCKDLYGVFETESNAAHQTEPKTPGITWNLPIRHILERVADGLSIALGTPVRILKV